VPIICHIVTRSFEDKAMFTHFCLYYAICVAILFRCAYRYCIHVRACILLCKETWQTMISCAVTKFHANILSLRENLGNFFLLSHCIWVTRPMTWQWRKMDVVQFISDKVMPRNIGFVWHMHNAPNDLTVEEIGGCWVRLWNIAFVWQFRS